MSLERAHAAAAEPLLRVEGLVKRFGAFRALDGLNFHLMPGEILGLVGPNGSGKTTCINVVRERAIAWLLSALIAGLSGGVFAWYVSVFYPETVFSVEFTIFAIVFALFGGNATVIGPILGVIILYGIYNAVGISTPQYFQLLYGALIMGLVMFLPNGLASLLQRWGIDVP